MRRIPAGVAYAAVTSRAGDGARAVRALAELAAVPIGGGDVDGALRGAGIDPDASAAVFGQAAGPTALLPVADAERLGRFLDERAGAAPVSHRGRLVRRWSTGDLALSAALLDGWLAVHLDAVPGGPAAWLDPLLDGAERASLAGDPLLAEAAARGGGALGASAPGLLGVVRVAELGRDLARQPGAPAGLAACAERAATTAPHLLVAADLAAGAAWAALDLEPGAARALRAHLAEPPPAGYDEYRAGAAVAVDWSVELDWLEAVRARLDCPVLDRPIEDPVRAATGFDGPRGWHAAAASIDLDDLSGEGALYLVLADPRLVTAQLEAIPARSLFERTRRAAGVAVRVLSVPGLPALTYRLDGDRFTLAVGDGVIEQVLAPGTRAGPPELARFAIRPPRLPDLEGLLAAAFAAARVPSARAAARAAAAAVARCEEVVAAAHLDGDSVAISARMRFRGGGGAGPARVRGAAMW